MTQLETMLATGRAAYATYTRSLIPTHAGNPLIEALPPPQRVDQWAKKLVTPIPYDPEQQKLPPEVRAELATQLSSFFLPLPIHCDAAERILSLIRNGYARRNSFLTQHWEALAKTKTTFFRKEALMPPAACGMGILGMSGVGKTTLLNQVLSCVPQVIIHKKYSPADGEPERPYERIQVTYLRIECPREGNTNELLAKFFDQVDAMLGTNHVANYMRRRPERKNGSELMNIERPISGIRNVALEIQLGVLVVDEIQNLNQAAAGGRQKLLNLFVELENTVGIPIILVGTFASQFLFKNQARQVRRLQGMGDIVWDRFPFHRGAQRPGSPADVENAQWHLLTRKLFHFQYTNPPTPWTEELSATMHDCTQGITDYLIKLFQLVQRDVIGTGDETITTAKLRQTMHARFVSAREPLAALRSGSAKALERYEDFRANGTLMAFNPPTAQGNHELPTAATEEITANL